MVSNKNVMFLWGGVDKQKPALGAPVLFDYLRYLLKGVEALLKDLLQFDFQVRSGNGAWGLIFPSILFVPESRTSATPSNLQLNEALKRREWGIIMIVLLSGHLAFYLASWDHVVTGHFY